MTIMRKLVDFELSRFHAALPGFTKRGMQIALSYLTALLAGGLYLFRDHDTPEVVFAAGVTLGGTIIMTMAMFHIMNFWAQPQREWWLTLPHPRIVLVSAKAAGLMLAGLRIVILFVLACITDYAIVITTGMMQALPIGEIASIVGTSIVLAVASIPVVVMLGLAVSTMYSGKARWMLIPYIILLQSPYVVFGLLMSLKGADLQVISPTNMLLYSLGIVVVGWPLAYVLLKLVASKGMANMADVRLRMKSAAVYGQEEKSTSTRAALGRRKKGVAVLYAMERARFQYYGSLKWVRIGGYIVLGLVALGAFLSSGYSTALLEMLQVLFMLPMLAGSIFTLNRSNIDRKSLQWWLGFPHPRLHLLTAQLAGTWVTVMRIIVSLSIAFWLGAAVGMVTGRMDMQLLPDYSQWFAYSLALNTTLLTVAIGILQASYYFMKSKALSLLNIPIYLLVSLQSIIINEYLYPKDFIIPIPNPDWNNVAVLFGIGVPIAAYCITLGAKHVHLSLNLESKTAEKS